MTARVSVPARRRAAVRGCLEKPAHLTAATSRAWNIHPEFHVKAHHFPWSPLPKRDFPHGHGNRRRVEHDFDPSARAAAKRLVFGADHADDTFIVLNASRPDVRKRIDLTLEGFACFARDKPPGVRLCLHHALGLPDSAESCVARADALGIRDRLLLNPFARLERVPADAELNLLYNACDVGLNTAMGEGWGLVTFEHAAAGAPQIVPRHSACADLWDGHALLVPAATRYVPSFSILELAEVAPADVAAALQTLYVDRRAHRELARAGLEYARRPEFRWEAVAQRWGDVIHELC